MNFKNSVVSGFKGYFDFSGRASRSEYWWFYLFLVLAGIVAGILDAVFFPVLTKKYAGYGPFGITSICVTIIPWVSVSVRRLHDIGRSGWWMLLSLTVVLWLFPLLYWHVKKGTEGPNRFGDDPLSFYNG